MLRIYNVALVMVRESRPLADQIARHDKDQAQQLRRSSLSVVLNIAEGSGCRNGLRRIRYQNALGSAREPLANLEAAQAVGYIDAVPDDLRNRFAHIIGVLVKLVY